MKRLALLTLSLLAGGLCALATAQDASALAGNWENAGYYVTLQVDVEAVTGTFRRYIGSDVTRGTLSGQVGDGGRSFTATWSQKIDGETETFSSYLFLAPNGKALNGFHWGFGGRETPFTFALRRTESTKRGVFLNQDTVDEGKEPPVPPPTNDPPIPTDEEEPLNIQPRHTPPDQTPAVVVSPEGRWAVNFSGSTGHLELSVVAGAWKGRVDVDGAWEDLSAISFDPATSTVKFLRAWCDQHYVGVLTGGEMKGSLGDGQGNVYGEWLATREATGGRPAAAAKPPTAPARPAATPAVTGDPVTLLDNSNAIGVRNGPTAPTVLSTDRPHVITYLRTYHWNGGKGAAPGTLALRGAGGKQYGPWQASGLDSNGGKSIMWVVEPDVLLPAGEYTVMDSDPATWGCNDQSGKAGFAWINGIPQ